MIWLKDSKNNSSEVITGNVLTGDASGLEQLRREIYDKDKYVFTRACEYVGGNFPEEELNTSMLVRNKCVGISGDGIAEKVYIRSYYENPRTESLLLLSEASKLTRLQKESDMDLLRLLGKKGLDISFLERVCDRLDTEELRFLLASLCPDFDFFAREALNLISFEEVHCYNISELRYIEELSSRQGIDTEASEILSRLSLASSNMRVLKLARTLNERFKRQ